MLRGWRENSSAIPVGTAVVSPGARTAPADAYTSAARSPNSPTCAYRGTRATAVSFFTLMFTMSRNSSVSAKRITEYTEEKRVRRGLIFLRRTLCDLSVFSVASVIRFRIGINARAPEGFFRSAQPKPAARSCAYFLDRLRRSRSLHDAGAHVPHARRRQPLRVRLGDGPHRPLARHRSRLRQPVQRQQRPDRVDAAALSVDHRRRVQALRRLLAESRVGNPHRQQRAFRRHRSGHLPDRVALLREHARSADRAGAAGSTLSGANPDGLSIALWSAWLWALIRRLCSMPSAGCGICR